MMVVASIRGRWCRTGESIPASADTESPRAIVLPGEEFKFSENLDPNHSILSKRSVMFDWVGDLAVV